MKLTPKEKAAELVEKMKWEGEMCEDESFAEFAKECALIAVDEIINTVIGNDWSSPIIDYWSEVKHKIQNYEKL